MGVAALLLSIAAVSMAFTSTYISENRTSELVMVTKNVYFNTTPVTSHAITSGSITSGALTTGFITTGFIGTGGSGSCALTLNESGDPLDYMPTNLRLNKRYYDTYYSYNLEWDIGTTEFLSYFIVYRSFSSIPDNDTSEAVATRTMSQSLPVSINSNVGTVYFRVRTVLVDGSLSYLSVELAYSSTIRVAARGLIAVSTQQDIDIADNIKGTASTTPRLADANVAVSNTNFFGFSPDGNYFAFISNSSTPGQLTLKVAATSGNTTANAINAAQMQSGATTYSFGFSRDSKKIFYVCDCGASSGLSKSLYVSDPTGSLVWLVRQTLYHSGSLGVAAGDLFDLTPQFTQSGDYIVWVEITNATIASKLQMAKTDGTGSVTTLATAPSFANFRITQDDQYVIYVADKDTTGVNEIYSVLISSPSTSVKLNPAISGAQDVNTGFYITPQSDVVIFSLANSTRLEYYSSPIYSNDPYCITQSIAQSGSITILQNGYNVISPDGTWMAFTLTNNTAHCNVFLFPIRGENPTPIRITNNTLFTVCRMFDFKWDPSGRYMVLTMQYNTSVTRLYSVDVSNGNIYLLGNSAPAGDGDVLLFSITDDGKNVLYISDERATNKHEVFSTYIRPTGTSNLIIGAFSSGTIQTLAITTVSSLDSRVGE
jgi:hypothetical protein